MKKHIFWIVPLSLFVILIIMNQGANYFNRTWFNIKHVLLFGIIIFVLLTSLYMVYRFFIHRYKEKKPLKYTLMITLFVVAVIATVTLSNLQIRYTNNFETPNLKECKYYDGFGNLIYQDYIEVCPELNIIHKDSQSLSFTVEEKYEGQITEPLSVENGVGYIYYDGTISVNIEVEITYRGPYVQRLSYSNYKLVEQAKSDDVEIPTVKGFMYRNIMELDFDTENQFTATYTTQKTELDMRNLTDFPSFNTIEPVVTRYISKKTNIESEIGEPYQITFHEITYDEDGLEIVNDYADGQIEFNNALLIGINFREEDYTDGSTTDYSFMYTDMIVKNRQPRGLTSDLERNYDIRTLMFTGMPSEFFTDDDLYNFEPESLVDTYVFSEFYVESTIQLINNYEKRHTPLSINGDLFFEDSDGYFHKFVFMDYGVKIEEYVLPEFSWSELLQIGSSDDLPKWDMMSPSNLAMYELENEGMFITYNYKVIMEQPGGLSNYHFYQHNLLVEHFLIDNYHKFD